MFILVYGLATMIWQIRHIKDDTLVKKECIVGLGFGLFINFVMTGIYLMGQYDQWCNSGQSLPQNDYKIYKVSIELQYWIILFRDLCLALITIYYCRKVTKAHRIEIKSDD
jgi:hypothetical protein